MSYFSKKIKKAKRTQIIAQNLTLDELIKGSILKELKEKFAEEGEIASTLIRFHIIPKTEMLGKIELKKGERKEIIIKPIEFITLEHPSPAHIKDKVIVITSNKNKLLEKFLK